MNFKTAQVVQIPSRNVQNMGAHSETGDTLTNHLAKGMVFSPTHLYLYMVLCSRPSLSFEG